MVALIAIALIVIVISLIKSYQTGFYSSKKYEDREPLPPEVG
jgi:uncharacterized protein YneF (UPF0154 family)